MLYTTITINGNEYKLRLDAQRTVEVEKRLDESVLDTLLKMAPENVKPGDQSNETINVHEISMIKLEVLLIIFHGSLQKFQHEIKLTDVYDLYDQYIEDGGDINAFLEKMIDVLQVSGFFPKTPETESTTEEKAQEQLSSLESNLEV